MPATKILLTTDLSDEALRAFAPMADFASAQGAEITLLNIVEDIPVIAHGAPLAPPMFSMSTPEQIESAKKNLEQQAASLPDSLKVTCHVMSATDVADAAVKYADANDFDLIALSSHGRSGFRRLIMGSVAENILRQAHTPVLVFPRNR